MKNNKKFSSSQVKSGAIRIIAGRYRGRKLPVLDVQGLRPTTDRVKETVFNWLMAYIANSHCLDCFAGSGGLGFEALSRGAKQVTFVELHAPAARQIKQNLQQLNIDEQQSAQVISADCIQWLQQPRPSTVTPYELVFVDPPFRTGLASIVCQQLAQGWLTEQALVYVEVEAELLLQDMPKTWRLLKEKIAGQVAYRLYQTN